MFWTIVGALAFFFIVLPLIFQVLMQKWFWYLAGWLVLVFIAFVIIPECSKSSQRNSFIEKQAELKAEQVAEHEAERLLQRQRTAEQASQQQRQAAAVLQQRREAERTLAARRAQEQRISQKQAIEYERQKKELFSNSTPVSSTLSSNSATEGAALDAVGAAFAQQVRGTRGNGRDSYLLLQGGGMLKSGASFPAVIPQLEGQTFTITISNITSRGYRLTMGESYLSVLLEASERSSALTKPQ
jgi:hypothetical protein